MTSSSHDNITTLHPQAINVLLRKHVVLARLILSKDTPFQLNNIVSTNRDEYNY